MGHVSFAVMRYIMLGKCMSYYNLSTLYGDW